MAYLGSTPETQTFTSGTDYFNGDGISVSFTLSRPVASVNDIDVVVSNVVQQPSTAYSVSGTTITFTSAPPAGTANVYARYLSTATQTLTPSPGTVGTSQISPSLTNVPFFGGSTLGAGNATGMKNRLINGGMAIDQRATSVTTANWTVDRFYYNTNVASKATIAKNTAVYPNGFIASLGATSSSAYSLSSTEYFGLQQPVEGLNVSDLAWGTANAKTVTLSFWVRSSLTGTFGGSLRNSAVTRSYPFSYTISSADTWEQKSITVVGDTTGTWLTTNEVGIFVHFALGAGSTLSAAAGAWAAGNYVSATGATSVVGTSGATFYITGAQLEEGNAATSFEFRDYGREFMMCQRYYYKTKAADTNDLFAVGWCVSTTVAAVSVPFPVSMRTNPTALEQSGTAANYQTVFAASAAALSAVPAFTTASTNSARVECTVASVMTAGQGVGLRAGSTAAYLAWSAEL